MMGKQHAISGAAVWLAGCAVDQLHGSGPSFAAVSVGTAVCAWGALFPDIDHPDSTIARSAGPFTRVVAWAVARFGVFVHAASKTVYDRPDRDGHRTVTHTLLWALLWGALAAWGQQSSRGPLVAALLVFYATSLVLRAVLSKRDRTIVFRFRDGRRRRRVKMSLPLVAGLVLAGVAYDLTPAQGWWLGLAVFAGSLTHCLGDALTNSACPLLWPMRIRHQAWFKVGLPRRWRFDTNGWVELRVVQPVLVAVCGLSLVAVAWPYLGPVLVPAVGDLVDALRVDPARGAKT